MRLLDAIYNRNAEADFAWLSWPWLAALYGAGLWLWAKFLNFGVIPLDFLDWAEITAPRLAYWKNALAQGVLPLHVSDPSVLRMGADRFFAVPDVLTSPQVLLLNFLEIGQFVLANTLLFYTIGFGALLVLRKRFSLSLLAFSMLFFLFNFNGHILTHISVGHANWSGYFLFPWLALLVFDYLDENRSPGWGWVTLTALLLLALYLQGAFHQFVWALIFLTLVGLVKRRRFGVMLKALGFAILLSLVRILPSALDAARFGGEFITGYTTLTHILMAMATPRYPWDALNLALPFSTVSWWEFDLFIGLVGTAFVLYFGLFEWLKNRQQGAAYPALLLPLLAMAILSVGRIYRVLMALPIPLLGGERVSSRIFSLVFVFLLILSAVEFQRWLNHRRLAPGLQTAGLQTAGLQTAGLQTAGLQTAGLQVAGLGLLALQVQDQWLYIKTWQVTNTAANMPHVPVDLASKVITNHVDLAYTNALALGAGLSALALVILLGILYFDQRKQRKTSQRPASETA